MIKKLRQIVAIFNAIQQIRKLLQELKKEEGNMKKGIYTTEFWLTVITTVITLVNSFAGYIPANVAVIVSAILTAVYEISRTIVKTKTPNAQKLEEKLNELIISLKKQVNQDTQD